jgi:hypothetical protein
VSFRWLKRLADWLDNRFPAKVHVTDEVFHDLLRRETERTMRLSTQEAEIASLKSIVSGQVDLVVSLSDSVKDIAAAVDKIEGLEKTIVAIKEAVSKAAAPAAEAAKRRAEFIASGRFPGE